jgi:hypothetical protein
VAARTTQICEAWADDPDMRAFDPATLRAVMKAGMVDG